jgi:16S rRNA (cytosine967-C5)-methyltransferase
VGVGGAGLWNLGAWQDGLFEVQDEGSQLIALATGVGMVTDAASLTVLDLCAGNGGKAFGGSAPRIHDLPAREDTD